MIIAGTLVAIPIPWPSSPSGCVEWRLVDWTLPDDKWPAWPVLDDGWEDAEGPMAWAGDYAVRDPRTDDWIFPDGERSDDEGLVAAFGRRQARLL
jgi:hypothetical protein